MPSNLFTESILKGKRDVSTYKKFIFQSTTDAEKYEMIQNVFIPDKSFVFPTTQRLFLHRWFKLFPWLCYSLVEDGAYCLPCLLFAGKKNTAAKSFIFKPFKQMEWVPLVETLILNMVFIIYVCSTMINLFLT